MHNMDTSLLNDDDEEESNTCDNVKKIDVTTEKE